jgi:ABC-type spermidine/putrescine transport system permease subunit II
MIATTIALLLALLLLPLLLVLLWATESTKQRTKRLASYGWSQRRIADHLHITRYRVRMAIAS